MGVRFRLLGPVEIIATADGSPVPLGGLKQRILVVALLLNANRPVSRERLTEALWGAVAPRSANANLHTYAARLRQSLAAADSGAQRLVTRPGQYLLQVEPGELDVEVFEDLAAWARAALTRGEFLTATQVAEQALANWRGPAAEGVPRVPLLAPQLEALDEQRLTLQEDQVEARLARGEHAAVVSSLRVLVTEHPLRERAWAQLMLSLYRGGDVSGALTAFQRARAALNDQLGIEPGTILTELQQAILNRDPSLRQTAEVASAPGHGRGRDKRGPDGPPRQLPRVPDLVGRPAERHALQELSAGAGAVVAAIHGPGGVGKSCLAIHTAHALAERFPDGQLYVDLGGTSPVLPPLAPEAALRHVLRSLGVPADAVPSGVHEAAAGFRSAVAGRRVLIVIDDAVDAAQVRPLLPAGPGCAAIVTSRRMLATLEGACHLELGVLPLPEAVDVIGLHAGASRVAAEPEAAAKLASLCCDLPLALRIAGARLATRPDWRIASFAARLADERVRLDELEIGELSVRTSIQMSYRPLRRSADPVDQLAERAFRLVGTVGVADVSLRAVACSLGVTHRAAEQALDRLVDARLVEPAGQTSYNLCGLRRLFAAEQAGRQSADLNLGGAPEDEVG